MGKGNENTIFLLKYLYLLKKVIIFVPENIVIHPHRKRWGFLTENYIKLTNLNLDIKNYEDKRY